MTQMKAMVITALGGPEVVEEAQVPMPEADGVKISLLHTEATAYNHIDAILRTEDFGLAFPVVPGSDVVGKVEVGPLAGRRVVVNPGIPCGTCDGCAAGRACRYVNILGVSSWGGYGEYVAVPSGQCYVVPDHLSLEVLAAFPLTFLTAWRMLKTRVGLAEGQTVLVWGASGGLGSAAISVTRALGGIPIAVTRRSSVSSVLTEYGAEHVVDLSQASLPDEVARLTDGLGVDVVFEGPGTDTWQKSVEVVRQGGVIVTAGVTTGIDTSLDIEDLYYRQLSFLGSRMGYASEFEQVLRELEIGRVRPLVGEVTNLSNARAVHDEVSHGRHHGKVVMINDF
jgi:NADPH:quinone reductase-like Zn-dependent oxidoreductase